MNQPPRFDGEGFNIWKVIMKMFIVAIDFNLWDYVKIGLFVPNHFINKEGVNKPINLWTIYEKTNIETKFESNVLDDKCIKTEGVQLCFYLYH